MTSQRVTCDHNYTKLTGTTQNCCKHHVFTHRLIKLFVLLGERSSNSTRAQWRIDVCSMWDEEQGHSNNRDRNLWERELDTRNNNWGNWQMKFSRIRRQRFHGLWKKKRNRANFDEINQKYHNSLDSWVRFILKKKENTSKVQVDTVEDSVLLW